MSYNILIFEPDAVCDEDFSQWWERVSRWEEPRDYNGTEGSTPEIKSFYHDLIRDFPPLNGPSARTGDEIDVKEVEGLPVADYTIGVDFIYISVSWSDADALVKIVGPMAWTQRLAVAYVSEDGSITRP